MKPARPKILYLVHRVPYPPNRGDRIRSFHLLKFLAERADVHLAFAAENEPSSETLAALRSHCAQVVAAPLGRRARWLHAIRSLAAGRTATEGLFYSPCLKQTVAQWSGELRFDTVVLYCSSMVQYLDAPGLAGVPVVVDLVDVDSQKWFDYADQARALKRPLYRLEGRRLRRLESSLPARVAAITLTSQAEVEIFRSFCPTDRVHAIPNGVDLEYFQPVESAEAETSQNCVFVGALDYQANIDGVTWFCREIWPNIRRRCPEATFTLVGSNPTPAIRRLTTLPGVTLAANVPDVRPYLARAAVVVVPLRIARGIQNKVLEALAMGKAVVATPAALKGFNTDFFTRYRRASTSAVWVDALVAALQDPIASALQGQDGRAYVEQHYKWSEYSHRFGCISGLPSALTAGFLPYVFSCDSSPTKGV